MPLVSDVGFLYAAGIESQPEAPVQPGDGAAVCALSQAGEVPQASLLPLLLPLRAAGETQVPHAGLEHRL